MRGTMHPLSIAVLLAVAAIPLVAQETSEGGAQAEPQPFARSRLEPGDRVTVGQSLTIVVEVLVPTWFTGAPSFPSLDVGDAIAIFEDRGINFTERIEGETWAGQSRSYQVYPQRSGEFEIAAIPVRVRYMSPSSGPRGEKTVSPPPVRFNAIVPPGAEDLSYFISTTELAIEQSFDREPGTLKVGDAFIRTITITVKDALSMVIPPLPLDAAPGLAVYPDPPEVWEKGGERGQQIVGIRVERTTYVAEKAGDYQLAPLELSWWDVQSERMQTSNLPALDFYVEPNPGLMAEIPLPPEDAIESPAGAKSKARVSLLELLRRWGIPLTFAWLIFWLLSRLWRRYQPALSRQLADSRRRRRESEAVYFARFRRAVRSDDPRSTWNELAAWLDRIHRGPGAATIRAFVEASGDSALERQAEALEELLFARREGVESGWSKRSFYRAVSNARRKLRSTSDPDQDLTVSLNPRRGRSG